jgi:hypothetical protein
MSFNQEEIPRPNNTPNEDIKVSEAILNYNRELDHLESLLRNKLKNN